jgi:hypothetical protein
VWEGGGGKGEGQRRKGSGRTLAGQGTERDERSGTLTGKSKVGWKTQTFETN